MNVVVPHTMQKIVGSTKPTRETGGTAGLLPAERARASFDSSSLTKVFQGQAGAQSELAKLLHDDPLFDFTYGPFFAWVVSCVSLRFVSCLNQLWTCHDERG